MYKRWREPDGKGITISFDGQPLAARAGDTVAAALIAHGVMQSRTTPVTGSPRAAYCMMGVCFDCMVIIDGVGSQQGCLVEVRDGMTVETQHGKRSFEG